jgi:ribosomal protein S27E
MAKKDIFKIDNYFIRIGAIFLIVGIMSFAFDPRNYNDLTINEGTQYYFEDFNGRTLAEVQEEKGPETEIVVNSFPVIRPLVALSGFVLLVIGNSVRRKENKIISIWDALERTTKSKPNDLVVSLGLSKEFILQNLKHINAQQNTYYVYLSDKDIIVDGRLLTEHTLTVSCKGCGNSVSQKVMLASISTPSCQYCGTAIDVGELSKMRTEILREDEVATPVKSGFSVPIFIALLVVFWPGALIYLAIKKSSSAKKMVEKMQEYQAMAREQAAAARS